MDLLWIALAYAATIVGGLGLLCLVGGQLDDVLGEGEATTRLSLVGAALLTTGLVLYLISGGVPAPYPADDSYPPGPPLLNERA